MDRRSFNRRFLVGSGVAAATGVTSLSLGTIEASSAEPPPKTAPAGGVVRHLKLYAEKLADGRMGYGFEKGKATVPGPLIEINEGDTLHIEFENTMDVAASLHAHGVDYDIASDGTRMNKSIVEPGGTRTYTWRTHAPGRRKDGTWQPGSAGYWHYHDHVVGTDHGSGGIRKGLYGPVIVRRKGDILPDKTITIVFNDMTINNKPATESPNFEATVGDRLEVVMITHGEYYHTFHVHGHRWADNRTGLLALPRRPQPGHRYEDRRPGGLLRLPGHRGRTRGRGRLDVPLPCAEPLRHGHGRAAADRQGGRHGPGLRPARHA